MDQPSKPAQSSTPSSDANGLASRVFYGSTQQHSERMLQHSLKRDPTVKFLLDALTKQGCHVSESFFHVRECQEDAAGGFVPGEGVVLCANHVGMQDEVNTILAHELVHAYDHCRARNMDWGDLQQHACSEIRAANLSGQCHLNRELLLQGPNFKFREGHKLCVRRKAQLSVAMNPFAAPDHMGTPDQSAVSSTAARAATGATSTAAASPTGASTVTGTASPPLGGSHPAGSGYQSLPGVNVANLTPRVVDTFPGGGAGASAEALSQRRHEAAVAAVSAVWDRCYSDTAPFTGIP